MFRFPSKKALSMAVSIAVFLGVSGHASANYNGSTATGLDQIVTIIHTDKVLNKRVTPANIEQAAMSADTMNQLIIQAITTTGVANDANISTADARELNDYIFQYHHTEWLTSHGDDENGVETGFHLVQGDGAKTTLFGKNAINTVADGIYHLGFESHRKNKLLNEDGTTNASYANVGQWLNALLAQDLSAGTLKNPTITEVNGSTGTGLDKIIDIIYQDPGLQKKISTGDIREGAAAADAMNHIIIQAIKATGIAADGLIAPTEIQTLSNYIQANHYDSWLVYHGDDEAGEETGFHLVQSDGAKTQLFGKNAINKIADSLYHLGFGLNNTQKRLINEDANRNATVKNVASWLNQLLANDLKNGSL
ncbi:MAG: hypothetical protein WBM66_12605 [Thiothrix litoralis]